MGRWFETIRAIEGNESLIRQRRYGMIETIDGKLARIQFRPWPKIISSTEVEFFGGWKHRHRFRDRCQLFYNQPVGHSNFLALKYIVSSYGTRFRTAYRAVVVLDQIAWIKGIDAIVAEVTNPRISDRLLQRWGWQRHLEHRRGRHYIKRFYGSYPEHARVGSAALEQTCDS